MPKVSVIIPVYGVEKYIEQCAVSLFEQTLDDIEYIFVDDCTPDRSIEIVESKIETYRLRFAEEKKVVRIVRMPTNSGLAAVRRHGIQLATGDYIIHCDSDDWVETNMYEKLYDCAISKGYDITSCYYYRNDPDMQYILKPADYYRLLTGPLWNRLVKRSIYFDNDIMYPNANKAEDGALMVQLSYYAKKIGYVKEPLYHYRNNPLSICGCTSEDKVLSRFMQEVENTNLRMDFLKRENRYEEYYDLVMVWQLEARRNLLPLMSKKQYREMWRDTYPELNRAYLRSPKISFRNKIRFVAKYLGLYR